MHILTRIGRTSLSLLFPQRCLLCGGGIEDGAAGVCTCCADGVLEQCGGAACPMCGETVGPHGVHEGRCRRCRHRRPPIAGTVRVGRYDGTLGQLIKAYKYHDRVELEPLLGGWLEAAIVEAPWFSRVEAVVSVPTHWKHRIGRPFYAADALASHIAHISSLPHLPLLRRTRAGPHQIGLSFAERAKNVRGAFALRRGVSMRDARLLLIDDVKTTGATIKECAKALRRGGASEVYAAVVVQAGFDDPKGEAISVI